MFMFIVILFLFNFYIKKILFLINIFVALKAFLIMYKKNKYICWHLLFF